MSNRLAKDNKWLQGLAQMDVFWVLILNEGFCNMILKREEKTEILR